eukprot:564712-Rhodomonas_salina.2
MAENAAKNGCGADVKLVVGGGAVALHVTVLPTMLDATHIPCTVLREAAYAYSVGEDRLVRALVLRLSTAARYQISSSSTHHGRLYREGGKDGTSCARTVVWYAATKACPVLTWTMLLLHIRYCDLYEASVLCACFVPALTHRTAACCTRRAPCDGSHSELTKHATSRDGATIAPDLVCGSAKVEGLGLGTLGSRDPRV